MMAAVRRRPFVPVQATGPCAVAILNRVLGRYLRLVAATVTLVIAGLPVAALACAHVCASHDTVTSSDVAESCHKADSTASETISSDAPDGCSLIGLTDLGTRERVAVTPAPELVALESLHVHTLEAPRSPPAFRPDSHTKLPGVPIATRLPLRI